MDAMTTTAARPIAISANSSWNLLNFRKPIITALVRAGWNVVAVVPRDEFTPSLERLGVEIEPLPMDAKGLSPWRDLLLLLRFYGILRRVRPAALLSFTAKPNIYGSAAAAWARVPTISTISGLGTGFLSGPLLRAIMTNLYRWGLRRSERVVFHNDDDRNLFVEGNIVRAAQAMVVKGSGVDLRKFAPQRPSKSNTVPTFLFIGRLLKDKGVREFIAAAASVKESQGAVFQMIGSLEQHPKAVPTDEIRSSAEQGQIELLGVTRDVRPYIADADCIVLPSYREGLPRVLLEAAAMGKPTIATDVPGCRDVVEHGITGLLCQARSPSSLADAMRHFATISPKDRSAMGTRARQKVIREFSEDCIVGAYLTAIEETVGSHLATDSARIACDLR